MKAVPAGVQERQEEQGERGAAAVRLNPPKP